MTRVVDGDTFDGVLDLGLGVSIQARVRLSGVDTPETWRPSSEAERQHGLLATKFVRERIEGFECDLVFPSENKKARDKYGRVLGEVFAPGSTVSVNEEIHKNGLAKRESY